MRSKNTGARKALENVIHLVFLLCGIVAVGFVLVISVYLILSGLPAIRQIGLFKFLFGQVWDPTNTTTGAEYGILPFILTSVYGTAGAMVIGVPIGLMTAIFLSKLAPAPVAAVIRTAVQLLAGIPSVVYGLVGMIVLVPLIRTTFSLGSGACLLAAILVLSIMVLPSIINVSETALRAVPREYEEASLALGATATETYFRVSLHAARSGVATAVVLGAGNLGRALIENFHFDRSGFTLAAAFDVDPGLVGRELSGTPIYHIDELEHYLAGRPASVGVLTVPRSAATPLAERLVRAGVKGIWNFTNIELSLAAPDVVVEDVHFADSLLTLSYRITNR